MLYTVRLLYEYNSIVLLRNMNYDLPTLIGLRVYLLCVDFTATIAVLYISYVFTYMYLYTFH